MFGLPLSNWKRPEPPPRDVDASNLGAAVEEMVQARMDMLRATLRARAASVARVMLSRVLDHLRRGNCTELWDALLARDEVLERAPWPIAVRAKALEMVRVLVQGHEAVARTARDLFPMADKANDQPTADLLTQRLTVHEQTAWMLRSLLED